MSFLKSIVGFLFLLRMSQMFSSTKVFHTVVSSLPGFTSPPVSDAILEYSFSTKPQVTMSLASSSSRPEVSLCLRRWSKSLISLNLELRTLAQVSSPYMLL